MTDGVRRGLNDASLLLSRAFLDSLAEGIVVHRADGAVVDANATACELLGLTRDQLMGRSSFDPGWGAVRLDGSPCPGDEHPAMVTLRTGVACSDVIMGIDAPGHGRRWLSISSRALVHRDVVEGVSASFLDVTGRIDADRRLTDSEARYRMLAENATDLVWEAAPDGTLRWIAPSCERLLGWKPEELVGRQLMDVVHPDDLPEMRRRRDAVLRGDRIEAQENRIVTASGEARWISVQAKPIVDDHGEVVAIVAGARDCHAEVLVRRAADTLSAANAALVRATNADELLAEMCQTAVDEGGYRFAWYGRAVDDDRHTVDKVAASREHREYLSEIELTWDDTINGRGPTGRAIRTGVTVITADFAAMVADAPWRSAAIERGFRSSVSLPVVVEGVVDGALMVYACEADAFDQQAVAVLEDLAVQLGYGLTRLRDTERLVRALNDQALLSTAIEQAGEAVIVTDADIAIVYANPAACRATGYTLQELLGRNPSMFQSGLHDDAFYEQMWAQLLAGRPWSGVLINRRRNGEIYEEDTTIAPVHDADGVLMAYVGVKRDLTTERRLEADLTRERSERDVIAEVMSQVRPAATLAESAVAFSIAATALDDFDDAFVVLVRPGNVFIPYGVLEPGLPELQIGVPLQVSLGDDWGIKDIEGPWTVDLKDPDGLARFAEIDTTLATAMVGAGFTAVAFAPIRRSGSLIGLLATNTRSAGGAQLLSSRLGALSELATFAGNLFGAQAEAQNDHDRRLAELQQVLAGRRFHPVFQPVVNLLDGSVCGYEALARFDDGCRPDLRFAAAHELGLGCEFEAAVAAAAIAESGTLASDVWLSVNFSPAALLDGSVRALLGCVDRNLVVEVTEHAMIDNYPELRRALDERGHVRVSVDDAGAGFASLRHILELRPDFVKLDIDLIRAVDRDPARQALVAGMCHFADQLGTTLIAEGVETEAQAEELRALGVRYAQGYLFGLPQPLP